MIAIQMWDRHSTTLWQCWVSTTAVRILIWALHRFIGFHWVKISNKASTEYNVRWNGPPSIIERQSCLWKNSAALYPYSKSSTIHEAECSNVTRRSIAWISMCTHVRSTDQEFDTVFQYRDSLTRDARKGPTNDVQTPGKSSENEGRMRFPRAKRRLSQHTRMC